MTATSTTEPSDPGRRPQALDPREDPRTVHMRHLDRRGRPPGYHVVARLLRDEKAWLRAMTRQVGRTCGVNPDDLSQELLEQLLTHAGGLDFDRAGWRAYVARRAHWAAMDMVRRERRAPTDVPDHLLHDEIGEAPTPVRLDIDADVSRLRAMGLNRDETRILCYLLWGFGKSAAEFADLTGASAAKVRQDKRRGLRKIIDLADLSPAEQQAVAAGMCASSAATATAQLGVTGAVFTAQLRAAAQKIDAAMESASTPN